MGGWWSGIGRVCGGLGLSLDDWLRGRGGDRGRMGELLREGKERRGDLGWNGGSPGRVYDIRGWDTPLGEHLLARHRWIDGHLRIEGYGVFDL